MQAAFWSIIVTIVLGVIVLIVNKLWDPMARYPLDLRRRLRNLADAVLMLRAIEGDLLRLDPHPWSERCKEWERSVQYLCLKADKIKAGHDGCGRNYFSKFYFVKEADKELQKATDLLRTGQELLKEVQARPHLVRDVLPRHPGEQLWGMDSYRNEVLSFIQDRTPQSPGLLGILGMGGVGKTCLLDLVCDSAARYAPSLDYILYVKVGKGGSLSKMQNAISSRMGLCLLPDETSQGLIIHNHLQDKNFLLLIDDVWEKFNLRDVGIPMPLGTVLVLSHGGTVQQYQRKVVFTTRSNYMCGAMGCAKNTIRLECLSEDDAWNLFLDKVGKEITNDTLLEKLARELMHKCGGLPSALCIVGEAMSVKKDPKEWRNAINHLKKSKLREINMGDDLFDSLKLSYDDMEDIFKEYFWICALWSGHDNIPMEKLIQWWIGLGLLNVSDATERGYGIIHHLVRISLLDKGENSLYTSENSHVKMHQITRKMVLWTVNVHGDTDRLLPLSLCGSGLSQEKWSTVQKAWVSASDSSEWSSSVICSELTMLVSRHTFSFEESPSFQNITFLDLEGTKRDIFPPQICAMEQLRYLNLSATTIGELPLQLQDLKNLKYLYMREIGALHTIPIELIPQLKKLRVLDLFCSGLISNENPCLSPLAKELLLENKDINLTLGITVHTRGDILKLLQLTRVVCTQALCIHSYEEKHQPHSLDLELLSNMKKLRELAITKSPHIQQLVAKGQPIEDDCLLPCLEFLEISNLLKLQTVIWKNAGFGIRVLVIYNCTELRNVTWVHYLSRLEELTIAYCSELEQVIDYVELLQEMGPRLGVSFGLLKKLYLEELPKLSIISDQTFPFEELMYVFVARCGNMKGIGVQQRNNRHKITIECNSYWWASLGGMMDPRFVPTFCF